jgi:hypothetical protein
MAAVAVRHREGYVVRSAAPVPDRRLVATDPRCGHIGTESAHVRARAAGIVDVQGAAVSSLPQGVGYAPGPAVAGGGFAEQEG